jgi:hypothetical protein
MIRDRKGLYFLIDDSIERDLLFQEENNVRFKCYLKKDNFGQYALIDSDSGTNNCSIKCIFNESGLKEFLAGAPSYIDYDSFNSNIYL